MKIKDKFIHGCLVLFFSTMVYIGTGSIPLAIITLMAILFFYLIYGDIPNSKGQMKTNIKIESDGTHKGTKIINTDTGEMLCCVQKVTWEIATKDELPYSKCTIELINIPIEITTEANIETIEASINVTNTTMADIEAFENKEDK